MNPENPSVETLGTPSSRIWYQSFVDPQEQRPYMQRLQERLTAHANQASLGRVDTTQMAI